MLTIDTHADWHEITFVLGKDSMSTTNFDVPDGLANGALWIRLTLLNQVVQKYNNSILNITEHKMTSVERILYELS